MSDAESGSYNYKVVRQFSIMTVVWGVVGMLVGVNIAAQLVWPDLNLAPWLSYGRLRPLHTNAVVFAFGGSALFATSYYVVQRTCHARLFSNALAAGSSAFTCFLQRSAAEINSVCPLEPPARPPGCPKRDSAEGCRE